MLQPVLLLLLASLAFAKMPMTCPQVEGNKAIYLPDDECTKFWECPGSCIPQQFDCPRGLHYNPDMHVCDWPVNVECYVPSSAESALVMKPCIPWHTGISTRTAANELTSSEDLSGGTTPLLPHSGEAVGMPEGTTEGISEDLGTIVEGTTPKVEVTGEPAFSQELPIGSSLETSSEVNAPQLVTGSQEASTESSNSSTFGAVLQDWFSKFGDDSGSESASQESVPTGSEPGSIADWFGGFGDLDTTPTSVPGQVEEEGAKNSQESSSAKPLDSQEAKQSNEDPLKPDSEESKLPTEETSKPDSKESQPSNEHSNEESSSPKPDSKESSQEGPLSSVNPTEDATENILLTSDESKNSKEDSPVTTKPDSTESQLTENSKEASKNSKGDFSNSTEALHLEEATSENPDLITRLEDEDDADDSDDNDGAQGGGFFEYRLF